MHEGAGRRCDLGDGRCAGRSDGAISRESNTRHAATGVTATCWGSGHDTGGVMGGRGEVRSVERTGRERGKQWEQEEREEEEEETWVRNTGIKNGRGIKSEQRKEEER